MTNPTGGTEVATSDQESIGQSDRTGQPAAASGPSSRVAQISNQFVADLCVISPMTAIQLGRAQPGDSGLDDLSPDGLRRTKDLAAAAVAAVADASDQEPGDGIARSVMIERLGVEIDKVESGWAEADLNVIASPVQHVRLLFDILPKGSDEEWDVVAKRMLAVPEALSGYRASLQAAAARGQVAAQRQIDKCAEQCATYAGTGDNPGFFTTMVASAERSGELGDALDRGASAAQDAYRELGEFLTGTLRDRAPEKDAVGRERYTLASREFLGATVDLEETYAWGWKEFLSLEAELKEVAERIAPGEGPQGASKVLDADPAHQAHGQDGFVAWMQEISDRAVEELGRTHFEIEGPMRRLDCRIAPPGGGVGAYYLLPSDDFSRPGTMWFSVEQGRETFSTWRETTVVYHEGVPGHHLQLATQVYQRESLNDFQRLIAGTSGHAEGWALYAERLVRELGYLDEDGVLLGMLDSQLFRAARVIVDIGMHLELEIPSGTGFHEGERWTPQLGLDFLLQRTVTDPVHCRDEIDRYLGWPGQAPSYKIGERVWLAGRDAARRRHGEAFDLKAFHTAALRMGGMGLDPLAEQLALL
jgi:uncharacterized protein (DUF885 family)